MSIAETLWWARRIAFAWTRPECRQQALDAACQAGGHQDDRLHRRARAAQVGVMVAVDQRLVVHCRVQRGEQGLLVPISRCRQSSTGTTALVVQEAFDTRRSGPRSSPSLMPNTHGRVPTSSALLPGCDSRVAGSRRRRSAVTRGARRTCPEHSTTRSSWTPPSRPPPACSHG